MKPFRYVNARSVREACALLREGEGRARPNAGGTDLLGMLKDEILADYPEMLVNLKAIPGLGELKFGRNGLAVGALATLAEIAESPAVRDGYPALAEAARAVATPQLRNVGTLGGNLCQEVRCWYYRYPRHVGGPLWCARKGSGPCLAVKGDNRLHAVLGGKGCFAACPSDTAIALTALDAEVRIAGPAGKRSIPIRELYTPMGTTLAQGELVEGVRIPKPPAGARQGFWKFATRSSLDFAIASVAAVLTVKGGVCTRASIALGAVAPVPVRATAAEEVLTGRPIDEASAAAAAEAALAGAKPLAQNAYKVEIAKTLLRRSLLSLSEKGRLTQRRNDATKR